MAFALARNLRNAVRLGMTGSDYRTAARSAQNIQRYVSSGRIIIQQQPRQGKFTAVGVVGLGIVANFQNKIALRPF